MLIIISPAKTMDMSSINEASNITTIPLFLEDMKFLVSKMQELSSDELMNTLKISSKLAQINYERYKYIDSISTIEREAIIAYNGSVYKSIKAVDFSSDDMQYAQNHLRIISTLYGLLRPLDKIKAYRISYNLKFDSINGNLYDYWLPKLTNQLIADANEVGGVILNLGSLDILGALDMNLLERKVKFITPEFKEYRDGKYETVQTYAKIARGVMTRHIIKNRVDNINDLKLFEWKQFKFNNKLSSSNKLIYTRLDSR